MWTKNSGACLGRRPTADYGAAPYDTCNKALISQQLLRSKMLILWINKSLITDVKRRLRAYKNSYN